MGEIVSLETSRRREPFRIVISAALWRGYDVVVEPATLNHPLQHFRSYDAAMAWAEQLSRYEGWPIVTSVPRDDGSPPPRAA